MNKDPYLVLEISRTASAEEIQNAYRKKAKQFHPDRNIGDPTAEEKFREVQESYDVLNNSKKKNQFDQFGFGASPNEWSSGFMHTMHDIFGKSIHKGKNIQVKVEITLEEAATGCSKQVKIKKSKMCASCNGNGSKKFESCKHCNGTGIHNILLQGNANINFQTACQACNGSGKIIIENCTDCNGAGYQGMQSEEVVIDLPIPAGVSSGQIRMPEQGDSCRHNNGINGDLIIFIQVLQHEFFARHDNHIVIDVPCTFYQLVNGFELEILNIYKQKVKVKIPKNTMPNSQIRIQRQGLPGGIDGIGDMFAIPKLDMPKNMPQEYLDLLEKLNVIEKKNPSVRKKEWDRKVSKL